MFELTNPRYSFYRKNILKIYFNLLTNATITLIQLIFFFSDPTITSFVLKNLVLFSNKVFDDLKLSPYPYYSYCISQPKFYSNATLKFYSLWLQ